MDTAVLAQLNDFDAAVRKQAITTLARSKDLAALPYLATVVRTDPDADVRELARKAGQYIQQNANTSSTASPPAAAPAAPPSGTPPPVIKPITPVTTPAFTPSANDEPDLGYLSRPYSEYEDEDAEALAALGAAAGLEGLTSGDPAAAKAAVTSSTGKSNVPVPGKSYVVTAGNQQRARDILETALTANMNYDNARAMRYLYQALRLNPNLINDDYYAKVASGVTGEARDQAIQMVIDQGERKSFIKTQEKAVKDERKGKHLDEARKSNWGGVWVDVFIYILINIGGPLAVFFVLVEGTNNLDPTFAQQLDDVGVNITGMSFGFYLPFVVVSALFSVLNLFLLAGIVHVVATLLLGGVGTFSNLLTQLLRLYNRMLIILFALIFVGMIVLFVTAGSPLVLCVTVPITLISLYLLIKTLAVVGEAYDFGILMGCVSVLVAYLVIALISGALSAVFANTVLQALAPMLTQNLPVLP